MEKSFIGGHLQAILAVNARLYLSFGLFALALGCASIVDAVASDNQYKKTRASADGIGKSYMGREIARVMGWQAADWLERPERTREERPDLLLDELKLKPGMVVADIGAGSGYHSRRMADIVGAGVLPGTVYAVDVQPEMVQMLANSPVSRVTPPSSRFYQPWIVSSCLLAASMWRSWWTCITSSNTHLR
jgi:hypothetical protein